MKKTLLALGLMLSVLMIGYLDFITPYEYSMALLYLIPVTITTSMASVPLTSAMLLYVTAIWFVADYFTPASPMEEYSITALIWIALIRLSTLTTIGIAVAKAKSAMSALHESRNRVMLLNQELEHQVDVRTAKLNETVTELESFSHSLIHDMRAPLRAMHSYAEIVLTELCPNCVKSHAKDYLEQIISASSRMDSLILDALNYSKLARGKLPVHAVDVGSLLREILQSYPNLKNHRSEILLEGEFPSVMANKAALIQCISNLLDNAVKFVPPGTKPQVRVWSEKREETVRLWVEDNGIGISKGWEKRIFQMFQQINKGHAGNGVGLAIVQKAAERMNGEVGVESEEGKGSRFWLQLPRTKSAVAASKLPHKA